MYSINKIVTVNQYMSPAAMGLADLGAICLFDDKDVITGWATYGSYAEVAEAYGASGGVQADIDAVLGIAAAWFGEKPTPGEINVYGYDELVLTDPGQAVTQAVNDGYWFFYTTFTGVETTETIESLKANDKFFVGSENVGSAVTDTDSGLGSLMKLAAFANGGCGYSIIDEHIGVRIMAKMASISFSGVNSVPTMEYKVISHSGDDFTGTQTANLLANGYILNTKVSAPGSMIDSCLINTMTYSAYGEYLDDVVGTFSFINEAQVATFNALRTTPTKLKYTPSGYQALIGAVANVGVKYVRNGFLGTRSIIDTGGTERLTTGYEIWTNAIDILNASDADRANRIAPPIDISIYRAGAIHTVSINLYVQ